MLILTRRAGESLYIGDNVKITVVEVKGHQIRLGIDAPSELRIYREEIYLQILEENKKAAEGTKDITLEGLADAWKPREGATPSKLKAFGVSRTSEGTQKDPEVIVKKKKDRKE